MFLIWAEGGVLMLVGGGAGNVKISEAGLAVSGKIVIFARIPDF